MFTQTGKILFTLMGAIFTTYWTWLFKDTSSLLRRKKNLSSQWVPFFFPGKSMDAIPIVRALIALSAVDLTDEKPVQESIDWTIGALEETIRCLKFQRNKLAPISRLPPELLGTIFTFIVPGQRFPEFELPSSWFSFTHVCRLWRSVALGVPDVWRVIQFGNREWVNVMLKRSMPTDLMVVLDFTSEAATHRNIMYMTEVLGKHAPRIREFKLFVPSMEWMLPVLLGDLPPSSLRLHSLDVRCEYDGFHMFPASIMTRSASEDLRDLRVMGCGMDWWLLPLTGLTSLEVGRTHSRPLWADFVTVLRRLLVLENLFMDDSLPLTSRLFQRAPNPINLAKLRTLTLRSTTDMKEVFNVLSVVTVPRTTIVKVVGAPDKPSQNFATSLPDIAALISVFIIESQSNSEGARPAFYQKLNVVADAEGNATFTVVAWKDHQSTGHPDLSMSMYCPPPYTKKLLWEISPLLPITNLVELTLRIEVSKHVLLECFGKLPRLQHVCLKGDGTRNFLNALIHKPRRYKTRALAYYYVSFPALQSLEISEAKFSPDQRGGFSVEILQDCLMERCNRNAWLNKLILSDCFGLYEDDVYLLREIVADVEWDEWEQEYESKWGDDSDY